MASEKTVEQRAEDRVNAALQAIRRVGDLSGYGVTLDADKVEQMFRRISDEIDWQQGRFAAPGAFRFGQGDTNNDDRKAGEPSL